MIIEDFVQIPSSSGSAPLARINQLKEPNDNSGRLFVNDLRGKFHVVVGTTVATYLDLANQFPNFKDSPGLGSGFTGFAFHPDFVNNGKIYTSHTETSGSAVPDLEGPLGINPSLQGVITEWTADDPAANVFTGLIREVLRVDLVGTIHGFQELAFNPNATSEDPDYGLLYICLGDTGTTIGGNPGNTHRLDSPLGSILRIDPLGINGRNGQYGIPNDNPWANDGDLDTLDEIWAYGFRNPHRISWDSGGDGKMLIGDIGERNIEEVNLGMAGADYGWNLREGTFVINPDFTRNPGAGTRNDIFNLPENDDTFGFTYPVAQYDHDEGAAIVGGYVYRGSLAPDLVGKYIFGDIRDGRIFYLEADNLINGQQEPISEITIERVETGETTTLLTLVNDSRVDLRFGIDQDNELYILNKRDGKIRRVIGAKFIDIVDPDNPAPEAGWQLLDDFNDGDISDWNIDDSDPDINQTAPPSAAVVDDPFGLGQGKVLQIDPGAAQVSNVNFRVSMDLPQEMQIVDVTDQTDFKSTLYFKVGRPLVSGVPGALDITWGLTAVDPPVAYGDYSLLGRYEANGGMDIRDGGSYVNLNNEVALQTNTYYEVWFVIQHGLNTYDQYIRGGTDFPEQTRVFEGAGYRRETFDNLINFFVQTSAGNTVDGVKGIDPAYFDDIWIDPGAENLETPGSTQDLDVFEGTDIEGFPGWRSSPWYNNYNVDFWPWIYHDEHGWQFVDSGSSSDVIYLWDLGLENWLFLNQSNYRWMFMFGPNEGWIFTFSNNTPAARFFQRLDDGTIFSVPPG